VLTPISMESRGLTTLGSHQLAGPLTGEAERFGNCQILLRSSKLMDGQPAAV
jgi:hypothetical protein